MLRYRALSDQADIVHFQWLAVPLLDRLVLGRKPIVVTAHDLLPREPRPGQLRAQRALYERVDAIIVHSRFGADALVRGLGLDAAKVHVIHHGAFEHLTHQPHELPLPQELRDPRGPVVLFFGLVRPYKGVELLLEAWRGISDAELWIVGRPRIEIAPLRAGAPEGVRFLPRFVSDAELPAIFRAADVVVLPYTQTERFDTSGVLATALAFGKATVLSDIGGFGEVAATGAARLVPPDDAPALRSVLSELIGDPAERQRLAASARAAAQNQYSWDAAARATLEVYDTIRRA
jgi:glycosyltransferase involved in cell wall biosynthesis